MNKMLSKEEIWKDVVGYEGLYKVSSLGDIVAYPRQWVAPHGGLCKSKELKLKHSIDRKGYCIVGLRKGGVQKMFKVHRIVAVAHIPNPDNKPEVNHKKGNKTDNRVSQLEWATKQQNATHAKENNLMRPVKGEKHPRSKLTEKQVLDIHSSSVSDYKLAKQYGMSRGAVQGIKNERRWKHLFKSTNNHNHNNHE